MRIRHKRVQEPHPFPVLEESPGFYLVDLFGCVKAFSKADYEPVPSEPTWVDVTSECVWDEKSERIRHEGHYPIGMLTDGYRVRKVKVYDKKIEIQNNSYYHEYDAFIIERRTP